MVSAVLDQKSRSRSTGIAGILAEVRAEIAACRICLGMKPFAKGGDVPTGSLDTGYMLVGEAPGRGRDEMLREALEAVGDERYRRLPDLFYQAGAVRCRPPHAKTKAKTRAPTRPECRNCKPSLHFEIRTLHPRMVVTLGARAAEAVLERPIKIEQEHGQRHFLHEIEVLTLLMPSKNNSASLKRLGLTVAGYTRWLTGLFGSLIDALDRRFQLGRPA